MTDKSISQQICELCGIEPKLPCKRCGASNFALGQCAEVKCKAVYPDFENNNNNFGKLFDLKLGNSDATIAGETSHYNLFYANKRMFLEVLYNRIYYQKDEWMKNLYKDSIRNADWEY